LKAASTRALALEVLIEWTRGKRYASELLDEVCQRHELSGANAALLHDMVLTVIRNLSLLDHWTDTLSEGRHLDHRTRWVLRLGLAQMLLIAVPAHAAVNETVSTAGKARPLVNALLRRADREREALQADASTQPLPVRLSHPAWLVSRWEKSLGADAAAALCQWNQQPAVTYVRVNPLHPAADETGEFLTGCEEMVAGFFKCTQPPRVALKRGLCYAQDPSTADAVKLLDPRPGETVLDACAAPGGKTALMAAMMGNEGRIIACDVSPGRIQRLGDNLQRLHVRIAEVRCHDPASDEVPPWGDVLFDRILLDVPCSNSGVMRRRVDVRWRLQEGDFKRLADMQSRLLRQSQRHLKPGGALVYSTCSLDEEENRGVVNRVLAEFPGLRLEDEVRSIPPVVGFDGAYAALIRNSH
jgi:16S rRNA (cytosine967-C5)-methyltransferase